MRRDDKPRLLEKILTDRNYGQTLVFTRTKHGASRIARKVSSLGHAASEIHGDRSLNQRTAALAGFKSGKYRVLVATDIAARGIDVKGVDLVINYDMPMQSADYVHRIGRTARAGAEGHAISFVLPEERRDVRDIERLIRKTIEFSQMPELPPPSPMSQHDSYEPERHGSRSRAPRQSSGGYSNSFSRGPRRSGPSHPRSGGFRSAHR